MPDPEASQPSSTTEFSWERWIMEGLRALRRTLFRYNLGLPDEFWRHLETASYEMLAAGRILLRTMRRRYSRTTAPEARGPIDIDWDGDVTGTS